MEQENDMMKYHEQSRGIAWLFEGESLFVFMLSHFALPCCFVFKNSEIQQLE